MKPYLVFLMTLHLLLPAAQSPDAPAFTSFPLTEILAAAQRLIWKEECILHHLSQTYIHQSNGLLQVNIQKHQQAAASLQALHDCASSAAHSLALDKPESLPGSGYDPASLAKGTLSLPMGGAALGDGFDRACPAAEFADIPGGSSSLLWPVDGSLSAGTWAYPGGGLHLGMDIAARMYSSVLAPADGVVLYASTPAADGGGYLGNWTGWPYGGGNTMALLCQAEDTLYGVSLFHLSSQFNVRAGQQVLQGDVLARSGNSGNSSGPHTHVELFRLSVSFDEAVEYFQSTADFSWGCGWEQGGTCSQYGCRVRPELYLTRELED